VALVTDRQGEDCQYVLFDYDSRYLVRSVEHIHEKFGMKILFGSKKCKREEYFVVGSHVSLQLHRYRKND
jgi:hypothetical protein